MKTQHFTSVLIIILFWSTSTYGQNDTIDKDTSTSQFNIAINGGLNLSNNYGDVESSESFLADFHIGAIIKVPTGLNFGIQVEPQFSRIGSAIDGKTIKRFTILDIPILAQVYAVDHWSFEAGPKIAITLDQKQRRNEELETVDRLKTVIPGVVAGATYNFNKNWFGQFRANYAFTDVIKKDAGDTEGTSILLFQLSLGYWFN
ncbi:porin family protein [uncultured Psychroserpens sp.]|uniref:porin family protein n=1 Tax=uncultured Psychroserpens sp. TaxID=255436 RepID=UPI00262F81B3|nr:porin family protein [uncultured Psychroserpens sp.]